MKLSIVVTADKYDELLALSLSRNLKSLPEAEFIFVGYGDHSGTVCANLYDHFRDKVKYYSSKSCNSNESKNIGIRRASGDFIISMDSDLIFTPELVSVLKSGMVRQGVMYRTTRIEIKNDHRYVLFPIPKKSIVCESSGLPSDFLLIDRHLWAHTKGYCETGQVVNTGDFLVWTLLRRGIHIELLGKVVHWNHSEENLVEDFKNNRWRTNGDLWGFPSAKEIIKNNIKYLE